jgi:hypothetical protein
MPMMTFSGKYRLLSARFRTRAHRRCRGFNLLGEVNTLIMLSERFRKCVLSFEAPSASNPCNR